MAPDTYAFQNLLAMTWHARGMLYIRLCEHAVEKGDLDRAWRFRKLETIAHHRVTQIRANLVTLGPDSIVRPLTDADRHKYPRFCGAAR
jgi:hypothetical protein